MPPSLGYEQAPYHQALQRVIEGLRAQQLPHQPMTGIPQSPIQYGPPSPAFNQPTQPKTPWGFHEPTITAGAGVEAGLNKASDVLADPRNAWMGLGPIAMATKPAGWGAEVLRRYKLLGGTHKTLDKTLMRRAIDPEERQQIAEGFKLGTDIAAPGSRDAAMGPAEAQRYAIEYAGKKYQRFGKNQLYGGYPQMHPESLVSEPWEFTGMESGSKGIAAYDAVSRQVSRLLDKPEYQLRRPGYGPEPMSNAEAAKFSKQYRDELDSRLTPPPPGARPNVRGAQSGRLATQADLDESSRIAANEEDMFRRQRAYQDWVNRIQPPEE